MNESLNKPEWLAQMEGILESLNEGVLILDDCGQVVFVNDCLLEMTGYPRREVLGRTPANFYGGAEVDFLNQQRARARQQGRIRYEFHTPRTDGTRVPVVLSAQVIEDPDGREFEIITFTDITEQKLAQAQLLEANRQLEQRQQEIEHELALAVRVQQSLVPRCIRWGPLAVETYYRPVRNIGGDFGVVLPAGDQHLDLIVCDVSGHGISSALMANRIHSELMSLLERGARPEEMLRRLNQFVLQIRLSGFYFTMSMARLAPHGRQMTFAAAGHPPAFLLGRDGACRTLESRSTILGLLENAVASPPGEEIDLAAGDRLVFYTDGLTEVFDAREEILGVEGLEQIVRRAGVLPLPEMKQAILDGVDRWRHGPPADDVSLVLVEVA